MKLQSHEKTSLCYFEAENAGDNFVLGKLAVKIKGSRSYDDGNGGLRRLECDTKELIATLATQ